MASRSVLLRATMMDDGRLLVAPGVAISAAVADVVADDPSDGRCCMALVFFRSEADLQEYSECFQALAA